MDLTFEQNTAKGLYPDYKLDLEEKDSTFKCDMKFHAESLPHWIAQDITNGELPIGLNFYKYGYIPNTEVIGTMKIEEQNHEVKGKGYVEHVWGDWSYQKPMSNIRNIRKTIQTYTDLGKWWLSHCNSNIWLRTCTTSTTTKRT